MDNNDLKSILEEYVVLLEDEISSINEDVDGSLYPDGQKLGIITALKDLQTCLRNNGKNDLIELVDYDPDRYLVGRL